MFDELNESELSIYETIKAQIMDGKLTNDHRITEINLSKILGVSRVPVREAIQRLLFEGFLVRTEKGGYKLFEFDEQSIINLFCFREAMDGMLTRLYCERTDSSQIYFLELNLENSYKLIKEDPDNQFPKFDMDFHQIIAKGSRNSLMKQQHEIIMQQVIYVSSTIKRRDSISTGPDLSFNSNNEETYEEHLAIFEAIKNKDRDEAERAARASIKQSLRRALMELSKTRK